MTAQLDQQQRISPYSVAELAILHGRSEKTVRRLYEQEPGVEWLVRPAEPGKRQYRSFRVPVDVYLRVKGRLQAGDTPPLPEAEVERLRKQREARKSPRRRKK